ncbi:hypothetical protein HF086_013105 [Spodoptera exigua]|uniref:O-acyltransferase n=1 Tax=Spodoptera exigua TaxID=7107 RepID=A0A922SDD0_SPOEX|nr:hypothetical protein HF086_013105 [Spodoptera exigua]
MTTETEEKALRYRRAQSVSKAEEITEQEKKVRKLQLDKPIHTPRDSLFSWSSEFNDFTGLVNWGFLMLSVGGVRLGLENFLKMTNQVFSIVPIVLSLLIEKGIAVDLIPNKFGVILQVTHLLLMVLLPIAVLHYRGNDFSFVGITSVCMLYLVIFLKLWSYTQTNYWCRLGLKKKHSDSKLRRQSLSAPNWKSKEDLINDTPAAARLTKYPDNLNLKDLFYFMLAPTLCYELNFPRTARIRKRFVIKRVLELFFGINLALALFQQWMIPTITNSVETFTKMDPIRITERLLKLAVPNHLIWLCFFYLTFHSFLNLMGELLQFADRKFYGDWWNANNISVFWSTWNMPVHMWAVRHVYKPITGMGFSKFNAGIVVFAISALFHEYLVSVPLQMFRIWAFLGMMAQPPLAIISRTAEKRLGPRWGNIMVWSSLILGQPLAIMMYYHDYAMLHFKPTPDVP